ncbi:hypothetical protein [Clostridium butyricum]|uniref:Uncharacterized protein n=1 Tax=Clostridium butyricum TaxID=1492 RepID=A0AAP9UEW7_CLOBU|nr:hypothetical protein [Clostridium butyricum]MBZ5746942.1 hypothetical protein [Clostridium butyricum]MDI9208041.1 hypothetical protein [Clostridium butyricum]QMW91798.1 hypothetical protein FF104_12705 [Clostridium butyricum]BBK75984.1 hypothetical protein Cbu04g_09920 [Clostridium butyricum]GEQ25853.1 hypothetical protein CBU03nite_22760 [Clostridium butyricum]
MARGNSKLYKIKEEHIKVIPKISNCYVEQAFFEGYMFVKEENVKDKINIITTTCSQKSFQIDLVNADVVTKQGVVNYRF